MSDSSSASGSRQILSATPRAGTRPSVPARLFLAVINVWRWLAPARTPRCRFAPTCSSYAAESLRRHGALRGGGKALRRLARCHPWHPGGFDPVDDI